MACICYLLFAHLFRWHFLQPDPASWILSKTFADMYKDAEASCLYWRQRVHWPIARLVSVTLDDNEKERQEHMYFDLFGFYKLQKLAKADGGRSSVIQSHQILPVLSTQPRPILRCGEQSF